MGLKLAMQPGNERTKAKLEVGKRYKVNTSGLVVKIVELYDKYLVAEYKVTSNGPKRCERLTYGNHYEEVPDGDV